MSIFKKMKATFVSILESVITSNGKLRLNEVMQDKLQCELCRENTETAQSGGKNKLKLCTWK